MPETGDLRVSEAVALAHALVARLAELEGVRILFIKGPTAVALGARPPRQSTDVDVLCEPGGLERLGAALRRCGWRRRVPESLTAQFRYASAYMFEHSVHYIHDAWPCDLDIHFNFPGFLAPDNVVFEELWQRRTSVEIAHRPVPSADLLGQLGIVALHALRDGDQHRDLSYAIGSLAALPFDSRHEFSELAHKTGAAVTLEPVLRGCGLPVVTTRWDNLETLHRWRAFSHNNGVHNTYWLLEMRASPFWRKPVVFWRAVFLTREELLSSHVGDDPGWSNLARLRIRRWLRGVRYLRPGLAAARAVEREGHEASDV